MHENSAINWKGHWNTNHDSLEQDNMGLSKKKNLFVFNNKKKSEVHAKNLSIVFSSDGIKINIVILPHIIYSL